MPPRGVHNVGKADTSCFANKDSFVPPLGGGMLYTLRVHDVYFVHEFAKYIKKCSELSKHFLELLTRLELVTSSAPHFYPSGRCALRFVLPVTPKTLLFPIISPDISGTPIIAQRPW